ncbi:MAG: DUF1343 domain-containing protein [Bacteroidales bacterium]|nr:DUF1343 domain-containing protein [Bacteroidales bacterium]
MKKLLYFCILLLGVTSCFSQNTKKNEEPKDRLVLDSVVNRPIVGAERMGEYLPLLQGKRVAVVGNQTSMVGNTHLVDTLLKCGIQVKKILTPEHGFRGTADAGAKVADGVDNVTGLPLVSLYGSHKKPTKEDLADVDIVVFDIQDVGARFYTYISTMHYVMEACAENNVKFLVLDRPNPNGHYVDGPVLDMKYKSFVGMHPVPIVHGMTIAEYARMINGEKWLANGVQCDLQYVTCKGYDHTVWYSLPIAPSPNLSTDVAIALYPTLCLFEGTVMSVGRGTDKPFEMVGCPDFTDTSFFFTPKSKQGASKPMYENQTCYGRNYGSTSLYDVTSIRIGIWKDIYKNYTGTKPFFNSFFTKLAGTPELQKMLEEDKSEDEIRASWKNDLEAFRQVRQKYLLYKDF